MEGTEKSPSSILPIRPSSIPKFSAQDTGEANENHDLNNYNLGSKLHNHKKQSTKHFMSPTISAASKAVAQKKKILAERNEAPTFSDTQIQSSQKLDFTTNPSNPQIGHSGRSSSPRTTPMYNSVSESDEDDPNTFVAQSSLKPYDPLTNYLSPRPKFLRYKPNRRCEIFLGRKTEIGEEKDGPDDVERSDLFDSQKAMDDEELLGDHGGSAEKEEVGINKSDDDGDSDEEMEEFEEKGKVSKGVLKAMLVFIVLLLSISYISSMNSSAPSPTQQAIRGLKDGYIKIHNHMFKPVPVKAFEVGSDLSKKTQLDYVDAVKLRGHGIENMKMVQTAQFAKVEEDYHWSRGTRVDYVEAVKLRRDGSENMKMVENAQSDAELAKMEEAFHRSRETEFAKAEVGYDYHYDDNWTEEDYHETPEDFWEVPDSLQGKRYAEIADLVDDYDQFPGYQRVENGDQVEPVVEFRLDDDSDDRRNFLKFPGIESDKIVISERRDMKIAKSDATNSKVEKHFEDIKIVSLSEAVGVFSIIFMTVAFLALGYHLKNALVEGRIFPNSAIAEKIRSAHMKEGQIENVVPSVNPSPLIRSTEKSLEEFTQSHAPTVKLLTEFEVGEASSSLNNCGGTTKSKTMEAEESSYSISQEKRSRSSKEDDTASSQLPPPLSEFSTMGSHSYGSFTDEKKIVKKEEGKDGAMRMDVTTPVRRSTRIRNRSATSPI